MNINQLLGTHTCSCGRTHSCDIEQVYIENGVINRLPELCASYRSITLVGDNNTYPICGKEVEQVLSGKQLFVQIFEQEGVLVPNEAAVETLEKAAKDAELIIGIGSGVMQDLCKYVSFQKKISYMIIATAPSMDG